jgi:transcription elongation factor Elf1
MKLDAIAPRQSVRPWYFAPCAQCGDSLVGPEWSEHVSEQRVRHFWSCDSCGYQFETTVLLSLSE